MSDLEILVDSLLFEHIKGGIYLIAAVVTAVIVFAVIAAAYELKKQKSEKNASESAPDTCEVSAADGTD